MTDYSRGYRSGLEAAWGAVCANRSCDCSFAPCPHDEQAKNDAARIRALPVPGEAPELNPHAICGTCGTVRERHGSGGLGHDFNETPPPVRAPAAPPAEAPDLRGLLKEAHAALKCETCDLDHPGQMRVLVRVEAPDEREVYELVPCGECDSYPERVAARARIDAALAAQPAEAPDLRGARTLLVEIRHELLRVDGGAPESVAELPASLQRASTVKRTSDAIHAIDAALAAQPEGQAALQYGCAENEGGAHEPALMCVACGLWFAGVAAPGGEDAEALLRECRDVVGWRLQERIDAWLAARAGGSRG